MLTFVALLLFGLVSATSSYGPTSLRLSSPAIDQIASVIGMSMAVLPTPESEIAKALAAKDSELSAREAALVMHEDALRSDIAAELHRENMRTLILLSGALLILFVLVFMNYYFDVRRVTDTASVRLPAHPHGELLTRL